MFQIFAIASLLGGKTFAISAAVIHAPYVYPLVFLLDYLLIIIYQGISFRIWEVFSFANLVSVISLAFLKAPDQGQENEEESQEMICLKNLSIRLKYGANSGHTILLAILNFILILLPSGLVMKLIIFTLFGQTMGYLSEAAMAFLASLPLYLLLSGLYYNFGHNWKLAIKNKPQNAQWTEKVRSAKV